MTAFAIIATILTFSIILFVEIGLLTIIILPVILFFVVASLVPMMLDGSEKSIHYAVPIHHLK
jgi:hypothetical protein